jgi:hypothetical protein
MNDFQRHTDAMFELVKDYATKNGLLKELSCLMIIREVQDPAQAAPAPNASGESNLRMAIQGETPDIAIQTIHYAAQILTAELRAVSQSALGQPQA